MPEPMERKIFEKKFFIAPFVKNGSPALLLRTAICNRDEISEILRALFQTNRVEIRAVISFRDPFTARARLKEIGLIT